MDWLFVKNRRSKVTTGMVEDHMPAKFSASPTTLIQWSDGRLKRRRLGLGRPGTRSTCPPDTGMVEDHMPAKFSASPTTLIQWSDGRLKRRRLGLGRPGTRSTCPPDTYLRYC